MSGRPQPRRRAQAAGGDAAALRKGATPARAAPRPSNRLGRGNRPLPAPPPSPGHDAAPSRDGGPSLSCPVEAQAVPQREDGGGQTHGLRDRDGPNPLPAPQDGPDRAGGSGSAARSAAPSPTGTRKRHRRGTGTAHRPRPGAGLAALPAAESA